MAKIFESKDKFPIDKFLEKTNQVLVAQDYFDHEIEAMVLGALILDNSSFNELVGVASDCFHKIEYKAIYEEIERLHGDNKPFDMVVLYKKLGKGFASIISEVTNTTVGSHMIPIYSRILVEMQIRRIGLIEIKKLTKEIDTIEDPFTMIDKVGEIHNKLIEFTSKFTITKTFKDMINEGYEYFTLPKAEKKKHAIHLGIPEYDALTGGFKAGELIIIGARPSVGKTALSNQMIIHNAKIGNVGLFFSLEMTDRQIIERFTSHIGRIPSWALNGHMHENHLNNLGHAMNLLNSIQDNIIVDDKSSINYQYIISRYKYWSKRTARKIGYIVIDYLGLMTHPKADRRDIAVGLTTHKLKQTAKDFGIPVILLAQLNRNADGSRRPILSDLRESGDIEQDADNVTFIHRPDLSMGDSELIVAKNRSGSVAFIKTIYDGNNYSFTSESQLEPKETPEDNLPF